MALVRISKQNRDRLQRLKELTEHNEPLKVIEALLGASYDPKAQRFLVPSVTHRSKTYSVDLETKTCNCPARTLKCYHRQAAELLNTILQRIALEKRSQHG